MNARDWRPSTSADSRRARAQLLKRIRNFFEQRNVLEVETPLIGRYTVTAPHLNSFKVQQGSGYLQTSPEYAMKRLLAAGSGDIYQIGKAFRAAERGTQHNSEFSLLEWYRIDYNDRRLMTEVAELFQDVLGPLKVEYISYRQAFIQYAGIDPFDSSEEQLQQLASTHVDFYFDPASPDDFLDLLLTHCVQPALGYDQHKTTVDGVEEREPSICFLYDFPISQAALAKAQPDNKTAQRFEVFVAGAELANGYAELSDAELLAQRWQADREQRSQRGLDDIEADQYLLAAQQHGLPECAGVAVGVDRLLMLQLGAQCIDEVISFTDERA